MPTPETQGEYVPDLGLWLGRLGVEGYSAAGEFARMTGALRLLQDQVVAARPSIAVAAAVTERLKEAADLLQSWSVEEPEQVASRLMGEVGRGQTLFPPLYIENWDESQINGRMQFHRFHLGTNGAAHGGAIALFFDDLLGQLANVPGQPRTRTASIRVDYRRIVPIEKELNARAEVVRRLGRKLTVVGYLHDGDNLVAEAEGLFIQLRSGQP